MDKDYTLGFYDNSDIRMIASLWLKQQDLVGKSPIEVAELYYHAISEINEKYQEEIESHDMNHKF